MSKPVKTVEKLRVIIPARREFVSLARLAVSGLLRDLISDEEIIEDIKLAISEICSSIVTQAGESCASVSLTFFSSPTDIRVDVGCSGRDLELAALTPIVWPEPRRRGYGLSLITALMDRVELDQDARHKTILRITKCL